MLGRVRSHPGPRAARRPRVGCPWQCIKYFEWGTFAALSKIQVLSVRKKERMGVGYSSSSVASAALPFRVGPVGSFPVSRAPLEGPLSTESRSHGSNSESLHMQLRVCGRFLKEVEEGLHHIAYFLPVPVPDLTGLLFPKCLLLCVSSHGHSHLLLHSLPEIPSFMFPTQQNRRWWLTALSPALVALAAPRKPSPHPGTLQTGVSERPWEGVAMEGGDATAQ